MTSTTSAITIRMFPEPSNGPDPEYELVKPVVKKGRQCGKCWMKFEYNHSYGFYCGDCECPMGLNISCS